MPTGKPLTEEHKRNISKGLKGRVFDWEHREKLSKAMKGNQNNAKQLRLF